MPVSQTTIEINKSTDRKRTATPDIDNATIYNHETILDLHQINDSRYLHSADGESNSVSIELYNNAFTAHLSNTAV